MAIADLLVGVISINPYTLYLIQMEWPLGIVPCQIWLVLDHSLITVSNNTLIVIAFDRFSSICFPIWHKVNLDTSFIKRSIFFSWTFSFLVWSPAILVYPPANGIKLIENECVVHFYLEDIPVTAIVVFLSYIAPALILMTLYMAVSLKLMKYRKQSVCTVNAVAKVAVIAQSIVSETSMTESGNISQPPFTIYKQRTATLSSIIPEDWDTPATTPREIGKTNNAFVSDISVQVPGLERNKKFSMSQIDPPNLLTSYGVLERELQESSPNLRNKRASLWDFISKDRSQSPCHLQSHRNRKTSSCQSPTASLQRNLKMITAKKRALRWILLVSIAFILSWFPYHATILARSILGYELPEPLWRFCYIIGWLNSLFNPICYAYGNSTCLLYTSPSPRDS